MGWWELYLDHARLVRHEVPFPPLAPRMATDIHSSTHSSFCVALLPTRPLPLAAMESLQMETSGRTSRAHSVRLIWPGFLKQRRGGVGRGG